MNTDNKKHLAFLHLFNNLCRVENVRFTICYHGLWSCNFALPVTGTGKFEL